MDMEQSIKRLVVILVASLIIIVIAKVMLSKAITNVGKAAVEKKQQAVTSQPVVVTAVASQPAEAPAAIQAVAPAASDVVETYSPASSPEAPVAAR